MQGTTETSEILQQLDSLLAEELSALKAMSRDAIDRITETKLALCDRLARLVAQDRLDPEHRILLERVHRAQLRNQLLVVHARDCVRGVLTAMGCVPVPEHATRRARSADGLCLSIRG
jgi:hypothetical protein